MMDVRERYRSDPQFNKLVKVLLDEIRVLNFTPTEIREAAMLAQIIYEREMPRFVESPESRQGGGLQ